MFSFNIFAIGVGFFAIGFCLAITALFVTLTRRQNGPLIKAIDGVSTFAIWGGYLLFMSALPVFAVEGLASLAAPGQSLFGNP